MFSITTGLTIWCSEAVTLAAVLFFAWRHDRKSPSYIIWSVGFLASALGFGLAGSRGMVPDILSIEIGNALTLLGESAWIAGFCRLDRRQPDWTILLPPSIWLAGVCLPWAHDSLANRVVVYDLASATGATLLAAAVRPTSLRREAARMPLALTFMALACLCFGVALTIVILKPSPEAAITYRSVSALGSALLITTAIALTGHLLMERSERRWRKLSLSDSLTAALNRRGLQEYFGLLLRETRAPSQQIAAILFDLDHFKSINDKHGHQTGDRVLCEFAETVRKFLPRHAGFGRMGGEEFMAFLTIADQTEAEALAETIRTAFYRTARTVDAKPVDATVSIGVAIALAESADWDKLTDAADRALYAAKDAGRNCTIVFGLEEAARTTNQTPAAMAGELVPTVDDQVEALQRISVLSRN